MTQDERFDALAKSESPKARFEAYRLAQHCMLEAEFDRIPGLNYVKTCDLQPGKWSNGEQRSKLIVQAALDGLPGAWWALREEGPGGRFQSFPESAEFRDLAARAYAAALAHADPFALAHEAEVQEAQGNVARALTLNVASAASLAKSQQRAEGYDPERDPNLNLTRYRLRLQPEVTKRAIADGLKLAAAAG